MQYLSTTRLARRLGKERDEVKAALAATGLLNIEQKPWRLTQAGKDVGGAYRKLKQGGEYVVWPITVAEHIGFEQRDSQPDPDRTASSQEHDGVLTATRLGQKLGVPVQRLNLILSELGWIRRYTKGWSVTEFGERLGGTEREHPETGSHYVMWPLSMAENPILASLCESLSDELEAAETEEAERKESERISSFRSGKPGKYRTKDGHWVRSRAEVMIDDALYDYGLAHAYERRVPVEEELYSDFYLPSKGVYIEYWGLENQAKYVERKNKKIAIYQKYHLPLIELNEDHLVTLDDHLPRLLLRYEIRVY
ncbi:MAG: glycerol kinase [Spirochaetes bacterium]|nr:glycerol kinase [Spirochaetota bacterium]